MSDNFGHDTVYPARALVDRVPAMIAYWDRDLRCRFANQAYAIWFGVDPAALVGTSLRDLLGPQLFALNEPYMRAALQGRTQVFERMVPGPNGAKRHSLATYVPDLVDGEVRGFVAHVAEVTQLKETEAALREEIALHEHATQRLHLSESALREAQRLGGVGSWEWEVASDITTWSEELYRIFGRDPTRLPPSFAEHPNLYMPESWMRLQAAVANALHSGSGYCLDLEYRRADGGTGWLEARGECVRGESGEITRLRGTVHEVTIRHVAEEARVEARATEAASRHKTELMSRFSHELRTPLHAIMGYAQLIQTDDEVAAEPKRWAEVILDSGQKMVDMVDALLALSAAALEQVVLQPADVDLVALVQACLDHIAEPARAAGLTLASVADGAGPLVLNCDGRQLQQVLGHLLSNALKFTPDGGSITVSLADRGGAFEIAVIDTGIGIAAGQLERIFSPLERIGAETASLPGAGLGLALCKAQTELMGGTVRVDSEIGRGSRFTITLPKPPG